MQMRGQDGIGTLDQAANQTPREWVSASHTLTETI